MRRRVEITDTLELDGLRWLDPELTNREVERYGLLLGKSCVESQLPESRKETAYLVSCAIAYLRDGFHVY